MNVSERLEQYLARRGLAWTPVDIAPVTNLDEAIKASGQAADFAVATVLIDVSGLLMVVHRAGNPPSLAQLRKVTGRPLQQLEPLQAASFFDDCHPGFIPPVGAAWDLDVLVDEDIYGARQVCFTSGSEQVLIQMAGEEFQRALDNARRMDFTGNEAGNGGDDEADATPTLNKVADRLKGLTRLPPMPALAGRMAELAQDPEQHGDELANLVGIDPGLAAQVLRYARSGLFGQTRQNGSLAEAIELLGADRLAHVARGAAGVRSFRVARDGALGINSLWRHSLYCAFMCRALAERLELDQDMAYLCGLLHNFGLLLIAWLYPSEFRELQALREINPESDMRSLEREVFGSGEGGDTVPMGHATLGGLLYRLWQLPEPVIKAAGLHQSPDYQGADEDYVRMVLLANGLLKKRGIGDELSPDDIPALTDALGLGSVALEEVQQEISSLSADLDALITPLEP